MINDLKPYPAMKDSGVKWLGEVPEHWEVRRIKTLFREKEGRSGDGQGLLLSLTRAKGLIPQSEASNRLASASDLSKYKACIPGDLVMNRMQAWSGMFAVAHHEGLVSPDYSVFQAVVPCEVGYFEQLYKTPVVVDQFAQASKGIGSGFNRLYTPDFGAIPSLSPPLPEQAAIVRYLDHVDRRVRRLTRAKRKLIALLTEQKQAIIHRAVTRGLDPDVPLKDSGVEWLGEVPKHWEVWPLTAIARPKSITGQQGRELLSVYLDRGVIRFSDVQEKRTNVTSEDLSGYQAVDPGDFVLNNQQAWRGSVGVSRHTGIVSPAYLVLALDTRIDSEFANLLFRERTMVAQYLIASKGVGSIQRNLYWPHLKRASTFLPPLPEQAAIVEYLDQATAGIDTTITRAERETELLNEYRTRLIADVVTGKLDVREAAARLPDEVEEPEPLDEIEAEGETDEASADDTDAVPEEVEA